MNTLIPANIDISATHIQVFLPKKNVEGFFRLEFETNSVNRTKYFCSLSAAYFYIRYIKHLDFSVVSFFDCLTQTYFSPNFGEIILTNVSAKNFKFLMNYYKDSWSY